MDALDNAGYTALHYAARTGNIDICKKLLYNGADINATTNGKATPLHKAAAAGIYIYFLYTSAQHKMAVRTVYCNQ